MRQFSDPFTILSAKAATGTGVSFDVSDYEHIIVSFATASSANLTVKFQGALSNTSPDFSAAQSVSNMWDYIEVIDLEDGAAIDGDTGIAPAGTDDFRMFQVNVDALKWFTATVTARSAGSVTIVARGYSA